jgi:hypothetical protein
VQTFFYAIVGLVLGVGWLGHVTAGRWELGTIMLGVQVLML